MLTQVWVVRDDKRYVYGVFSTKDKADRWVHNAYADEYLAGNKYSVTVWTIDAP